MDENWGSPDSKMGTAVQRFTPEVEDPIWRAHVLGRVDSRTLFHEFDPLSPDVL